MRNTPAAQSVAFGRARAERTFYALVLTNRDPLQARINEWTDRPPKVCSWYLRRLADDASAKRWDELCQEHRRRLARARRLHRAKQAAVALVVGAAGTGAAVALAQLLERWG